MKALLFSVSLVLHALVFFVLAKLVISSSKIEEHPSIKLDILKRSSVGEVASFDRIQNNDEYKKILTPKTAEFASIKNDSDLKVVPPRANENIVPKADFIKIEFDEKFTSSFVKNISTPAKLLKSFLPNYPNSAIKNRLEGIAIIEFEVNEFGAVQDLVIVKSSGYKILDIEAKKAIQKSKFKPALLNNTNVSSRLRVPIEFKIKK